MKQENIWMKARKKKKENEGEERRKSIKARMSIKEILKIYQNIPSQMGFGLAKMRMIFMELFISSLIQVK